MTQKVAIVTDSTACIPQELAQKYNIEIVPVVFIFGERAYQDGIDMSTAEFYERLRQEKKLPTTSGSLPASFLDTYRKASQKADSILCITVPSKLSGMYNSALMAADMAKESLHNIRIKVLDCSTAAAGQGLVVLEAAREAAKGMKLDEIINITDNIMPRVHLLATLDTLKYLVKGGRVPLAAALATSLLQIKPIFTVSSGEARPLTNARTMTGAIKHLLKLMEERVKDNQKLRVAIMHADALDRAEELRSEIRNRFNCTELFTTEFTPVMGVHTGPGVIGVAFFSED